MKRSTLVFVASATCFAGIAQANSVTYVGTFNGLTDVANQAINVHQFDSSLGTLQSAIFSLDATMTTSAFAANDGNFKAGWDKSQYSLALVGDTGYSSIGISASIAPIRVVGSGTVGGAFTLQGFTPADLSQTYQAPGSYLWNFAGPALTASQTFNQGVNSAFLGTGNLNFFLTTLNYDTLSIAGAQTGGFPAGPSGLNTQIASTVSVTYVYAPVPEPEPYALMLAGLGLLGFAARRRRSASF
jgi:hypothetical protein